MQAPIKIQEHNGAQAVSARELHNALEVQTKFADWVKRRIAEYGFAENQDYTTLSQKRENGGKQIDYIITLDMAKELAMVERSAQGRAVRQYFIECEKELRRRHEGSFEKNLSATLARKEKTIRLEIANRKAQLRELECQLSAVLNTGRPCPYCGVWFKSKQAVLGHQATCTARKATLSRQQHLLNV